ncbi:putative plastid-lipid-associated fibrillin [Chloropicon primus]|uniref:Putative plastid-lipid-associated fibrillin n=2 Tax=Chloropicon primus TaxID=1764295 RepID=A0A5B8MTL9_9CHLO|nr:putative plastid-lipid-associated fibrillin [Chloropicon primus]UPR02954.1 putative plastid-lipid-associated fibrillin [Chloropicon primus]|eukprot:QDZ23741.1 putative plastid-lipid-associated fibrillin [Chloropicon primus]
MATSTAGSRSLLGRSLERGHGLSVRAHCYRAKGLQSDSRGSRRRSRYSQVLLTYAGEAESQLLSNEGELNETILAILEDVKGTDSGAAATPEKRKKIDGNIEKLIDLSSKQSPLSNPGLFATYSVVYTSPGPGVPEGDAPAGGRFRGKLGRLLFRTSGLYQAILRPNIVKNMVTFHLFGLLPGSIQLAGTFVTKENSTVQVVFERPKFTLFGQTFNFGPKSSVELETPALYANKIRIGRGKRGSLFVFTVDEKSKSPGVLKEMEREPSKLAWVVVGGVLAALGAGLFALQRAFGPKPLLLMVGLLLAVGSVLKKGGIQGESEIKE